MGPLTQSKEWDDSNLAGVHRFLGRVTRAFVDDSGKSILTDFEPTETDLKALHKNNKKVSADVEALSFNTAVAQMMIVMNHIYDSGCRSRATIVPFIQPTFITYEM